ncbi:MAG: hypothetical protein KGN16_20975 [Burkholderiales bacterium]|nr:hypothetical protein [Burkholderiales bacterium]
MPWTDRELKRRAERPRATASPGLAADSESARMRSLWGRLKACNAALPQELRLTIDAVAPAVASAQEIGFIEWMKAPAGAALGYTGHAIRYLWPEPGLQRSNNFWIRWNDQRQRYVLLHRTDAALPPTVAEYRFDERRAGYMLKRLVQGRRIRARSLRSKFLGLF